MKKSGGAEKKRVRRSAGAVQNGGRDPNSDTPPRVCSFSLSTLYSLSPDLGFLIQRGGNSIETGTSLIRNYSVSYLYIFVVNSSGLDSTNSKAKHRI